jgi:hypothetical protein
MASTGFELTIPALKWLQSYVLDRTATGSGLPTIPFRLTFCSNERQPRSISTENMDLDNPSEAVRREIYSIVTANIRERNVIFYNIYTVCAKTT